MIWYFLFRSLNVCLVPLVLDHVPYLENSWEFTGHSCLRAEYIHTFYILHSTCHFAMHKHTKWVLFFLPALLRCNWSITLCKLKAYNMMVWHTHILQNEQHIDLANTLITSYNDYVWWGEVRTFKIYSLRNFQLDRTVLLTIVTVLDIRSYSWALIFFLPY